MPYTVSNTVYVVINDVPMSTPAWEVLNPMVLRQGPATRGTDRLIPGATGVLPGPRRGAPRSHLLQIVVRGEVDWEGDPYADAFEGCDANLMHLRENVTDPRGDPVDAELHLPDGSVAVGVLHVESFEWNEWGSDAQGVIDVTLPYGALTDGGGS